MDCQVVVVGDAKVGKSALIRRLTQDQFSERYTPTSFDKTITEIVVDNQPLSFVIWDTSGSSAYDSVRSLSYAEADVFLVCYKVSDPSTLYNVKSKWMPEIRRHKSNVPVILCGCQNDLRHDPEILANLSKRGRTPVSPEQALAICCDVGAANYVETSALTSEVIEAFEVCGLAFMKSLKYNTGCSQNSGRFNTASSKTSSNKLNISCETAEFSAGQLAQPQPLELEDYFPASPIQRRRINPGAPSATSTQRASFSAKSESSPAKNLLRKASFRSPTSSSGHQMAPVSQNKAKAYESLKSQGSTGSTGSKTSTNSCSSSVLIDLDENVPNTEDPELLKHLSFVSPKSGVYRPVSSSASAANSSKSKSDKDKCILM